MKGVRKSRFKEVKSVRIVDIDDDITQIKDKKIDRSEG